MRLVAPMAMLAAGCPLVAGCSLIAGSTPSTRPPPPLRCKTKSGAPVLDTIMGGLGLIPGTVVIVQDLSSPHEFQGLATIYLGAPLVGIGALYSLSALYGFTQTSRCRRFHDELGIPVRSRSVTREARQRAWELTLQAETAAHAGDCTVAARHGPHVKRLDPELHATAFQRSAVLARCQPSLGPPSTTAPLLPPAEPAPGPPAP